MLLARPNLVVYFMSNLMLLTNEICPVCSSAFICELQQVYLQRQQQTTAQYFCMECNSIYHRSGYRESEDQLRGDTEWLLAHPGDYSAPIADLKRLLSNRIRTCFEVGCGAGDLLHQLEKHGYQAAGIDQNADAVSYAVKNFGVDARVGYFEVLQRKADLILCIDVMEHFEQPRPFFKAMVESLEAGGILGVRVPYVETNRWHYLFGADRKRDFNIEDPWCDNSVHITHFSSAGLIKMASDYGLPFVKIISALIYLFSSQPISEPASDEPQKAKPFEDRPLSFIRRSVKRLRRYGAIDDSLSE
jgi:2-polyprenyl-3-methyl-5-hydroxy-6-metoxy-1,4-benzoquinol methylase